MAVAKTAHVVGTEKLRPDTLLLDLCATEPLGFVGGQYLILDSRIILPSGKAVKRAYSFLTGDAEQRRFQLAVKRIPDGLGSAFAYGPVSYTHLVPQPCLDRPFRYIAVPHHPLTIAPVFQRRMAGQTLLHCCFHGLPQHASRPFPQYAGQGIRRRNWNPWMLKLADRLRSHGVSFHPAPHD